VISYINFHSHDQQDSVSIAEASIRSAVESGISHICLGGTHPEDWKKQVQLLQKFPQNLFLNFGLHPWWIEQYSRAEIGRILEQLDRELPLVSGLGETGLDFFEPKRDPLRFEDQRFAFRAQLELAKKHRKPLVLHVVNAHSEAISTVKEVFGRDQSSLIIHRFSGTWEDARSWLSLGAYLSFHEPKKMMGQVPVEQLLLETDSHSGVHPGGWDIRPHYEKSAKIMGLHVDALAQKMAENFVKIGYSQPK
jgi:TatD DNase family protein